jgi:hypothetical protein
MWKYLNKGISTPIAITIILILAIVVGGFTWWQYTVFNNEDNKGNDIVLPSKELQEIEVVKVGDSYRVKDINIEFFHGGPGSEYSLNCFAVYKNEEKIGEECGGERAWPPLAFNYGVNDFIIIPIYPGGNSNPMNYFIYTLNEEGLDLHHYHGFNDLNSLSNFLVEKDNKLYLKIKNRYSYDNRSVSGIMFNYYYLIENGEFEESNDKFKEEYIKNAEESEACFEKTVNYLLAGENNKAWEAFDDDIDILEQYSEPIEPDKIKKALINLFGNETADWEVYRNGKIGFEFKLPPLGEWERYIKGEYNDKYSKVGYWFDSHFDILEKENKISFNIQINCFGEDLSLPHWTSFFPVCVKETEALLLNNKVNEEIHSAYQASESVTAGPLKDCSQIVDSSIKNQHSVGIKVCINKEHEIYYPTVEKDYSELRYVCDQEDTDSLYNMFLLCEGKSWEGKDGADNCSQLFEQILSTFRFID